MDTAPEAVFDHLTQEAKELCRVPMALITLVGKKRQWFKSSIGVETTGTPRDQSFCAHALLAPDEPLIVPDAAVDPRFADNPSVTGSPHIRFYAGIPLRSPEGYALGTLCVLDNVPRRLSPFESDQLHSLAQQISFQIALRQRTPTEQRLTVGFAVTLALLSVMMCFAVWQANLFLSSDQCVEHANEVIRLVEEVVANVQAAESNQRGFSAGGQDTFLLPYQEAVASLPARLSTLRREVGDNAAQVARIATLDRAIAEKLAVMQERIQQRRELGAVALDGVHLDGRGRRTMEKVLGISRAMIATETTLLQERRAARAHGLRTAEASLLGTGLLCLGLLIGGYVMNQHELRRRQVLGGSLAQANDRLATANREMETRVQARTAELAQTVERLRESEGRLHTVLNAAPVVLFATDAAGVLTFSEGKELEALGIQPSELVGRSIAEVHGDGSDVLRGCRRALAGESVELETVFAGVTIEIRFSPTRAADGTIIGLTGIAVDVSTAKQVREHLQQAKEEAERANNAKSEFLSRMSHELRTPLNAVLGFAQILEIGATSQQDSESIQQILKAGRHLLVLIDEVLDISNIETGHLELTLKRVSVEEVARAALTLLEPLAKPRQIRLEMDPHFSDFQVLADRVRLQQSLLNLLSNAVKFNRESGAVRVSCERRDGQVRVLVKDTGLGISNEDAARLFVPFERLDANERNIDGCGIGLALSKRLIESQGGRIGGHGTPGQGSTFWIELPAAVAV